MKKITITPQQEEALIYLAQGYSPQKVAELLNIHIQIIYE